MNSVNLIGRITKDLELRYTTSNIACVAFTIAINNGKDKNGEERKADFPRIYVYEKQAENLVKYCDKGRLIAIDGRIKTRDWLREDGTKVYETYVIANRIEFLESKPREEAPLPEPEYTSKETVPESDPFKDFGEQIEIDYDLPFLN